jgi:competence protein ComEA
VRLLFAALGCLLGLTALDLARESPAPPLPPRVRRHRVHVNRASAAELRGLPGVGAVLAGRIVSARRRRAFRRAEDLAAVHGVGAELVRRIRPYVRFGPAGIEAHGSAGPP